MIIKYFRDIFKQYKIIYFLFNSFFISFFLLLFDYYNCFSLIQKNVVMPLLICIVIILLLKLFSLKALSLLKINSVNYIDFYSLASIFGIAIYKILSKLYPKILTLEPIETKMLSYITITLILIIIFRYIFTTFKTMLLMNKSESNVYTLLDLYENKIKEKQFFLLDDKDVDYDLLERNKIITQITNTILNCKNETKFVMSLKGSWGSGKTTILNNVKKKLKETDIIYIDNFEPWVYENKESLLIAFFDTIMENINCGFRINDFKIFSKKYLKTITSNVKFNFNDLFENNIDITRIKEIINNYLESNNKKIVLVLDNLERCQNDQIIFVLKVIHNLFDFKRIIYILSYDDDIMRNIFENSLKIDYSYLEKIIQLEFSVPNIDDNVLRNVITKCLKNYLNNSSILMDEESLNVIINILVNNINDLRDFKRVINSTFNASFNNQNYLNNVDMLLIELIALKNPSLWQEISNNSIYYISEDRYVYENDYIYDSKKYNKDTTKYYNEIFSSNKFNINKYKDILSYLFPNIKLYLDETKFDKKDYINFIPEQHFYKDTEVYEKSITNKRIFNSKYFNLYFSKNENEFIVIDNQIKKCIDIINSENAKDLDIFNSYLDLINIFPGWIEKYTLETFQLYLNKIDNNLLKLLQVIYSLYYINDDSPLFFQLNAQQRTQIIISDIILLLNDDDFNSFIDEIKEDYKNLHLIREISYWLKPENRQNKSNNEERYKKFNKIYEDLFTTIRDKKINLYDTKNYNRYNTINLFEIEEYQKFIKKKINKNNLPLFILDCISISTGSYGIGYNFDTKKIDDLYGWDKAKKDIYECPESELKDFLIKAIETPNLYKSYDEKDTYHVKQWISLSELINKYLNR